MTRHLVTTLALVTATGCSAEFIDFEQHTFACTTPDDCSGSRICFAGQCMGADETPLPAHAVIVEDVSSGASCETTSSGSDLFAVVVARKNGPILAIGSPHSRRVPNGRGFSYGTGPNVFTDTSRWNRALREEGESYFSDCPPFQEGPIVSLGCGGDVFMTFSVAPWRSNPTSESFELRQDHEVLVYEYGTQCSADPPLGQGDREDKYQVRICPRTAFTPGQTGEQVDSEECPLAVDLASGYRVAPIVPKSFVGSE